MSHTKVPVLCICSAFGRTDRIAEVIGGSLFPKCYKSSVNPSEEFAEVKASGEPIVLVVLGPIGHDAIKYLCDDTDIPQEKRRVRWIHSVSAGVDFYKLSSLQKEIHGVPFTTGKGGYSYMLAIHVVYSVLYFLRDTTRFQRNRAAHRWDPFDMAEPQGVKVGIIGYGDIGQMVAKMLRPMEMSVTGVRRSVTGAHADAYGANVVSGEEARTRVLSESDFVVNILPLTDVTRGYFNKDVFASMKSTAIYINIGRGGTQNEEDLCAALRNGDIQGASLDVFNEEPLPEDSPLWDIEDDKILITSHNACITANSFRQTVGIFVDYAKRFIKGEQINGYQPNISEGY